MKSLMSLLGVWAVVVIAGIIGWVFNIINICSIDNLEWSGPVILQIVGIFVAPLGAVLGYVF